MIIRQTTTIVFEYPQDYLQEQEWCKTKEDRWIHKSTSTLGAVYENTISYSIGQPNSSEKPNKSTRSKMEQVEDEPMADCGDFANRLAYERGVKHAWEVAQKVFDSTVTFYEAEDVARQIDKDINVRSKTEPKTQTETQNSNLTFEKADEPRAERRCTDCRFLTHKFGKVWCDIKCDNPHDVVCERWEARQTDCQWR